MTQNQFKPFATSQSALVQSQEEYENSPAVRDGFRKGLARSQEVNKAIRQATSIAAAVAQFTADKSGEDMLDNGDINTLKQNFEMAIGSISASLTAEAEGTADGLVASFTPKLKQLTQGKTVLVRAKEKNTGKIPTLKVEEFEAKPIVKGNNLSLEAGDIAGGGHWLELQYDSHLDKWVLQNPAKGISPLNGVPVGTVEYFAAAVPPAGYLKADGAEVGRETYPDLFNAIGTTFGEGDRVSTFNLPDLMGRFAQGCSIPGMVKEAGLPDIQGTSRYLFSAGKDAPSGSFSDAGTINSTNDGASNITFYKIGFAASNSNSTYGNSDTVQPPALTLLPCIKAFDAATNPGLVDITELANEVYEKAKRDLSNVHPTQPFKVMVTDWCSPDYSAGISIASPFIAPCAGIFIAKLMGGPGNSFSLSVNNNVIVYSSTPGAIGSLDRTDAASVSEGDVITYTPTGNTSTYMFFPMKGAI